MVVPECFGVFWEGIPGTPECHQECRMQAECLQKFATGALVEALAGCGEDIPALADELGVAPQAVQIALDHRQRLVQSAEDGPKSKPKRKPKRDPDPVPSRDDEAEEAPKPRKKPGPKPRKKPGPKPRKKPGPKPRKKPGPKPRKKPGPKPRKKEAQELPEEGGADRAPNFPEAGAALPVAAPAKKTRRAASAVPVGERVSDSMPKTWGSAHDRERWRRERKRNPLIRALPKGYVLEKEWPPRSGEIQRVLVETHGYQYRGRRYPTLYAAMIAIPGVLRPCRKQRRRDGTRPEGVKWSPTQNPARFFGLTKILLTLKEERRGKGRCPRRGR